jgi:hypothetical protein
MRLYSPEQTVSVVPLYDFPISELSRVNSHLTPLYGRAIFQGCKFNRMEALPQH